MIAYQVTIYNEAPGTLMPRAHTLCIVIPTIGESQYLHEALLSCVNQIERPDQLILICNGIDPQKLNISHIRDKVTKTGTSFSLLQNAERLPHSVNWSSALGTVKTDVVAFLSDDDLYEPDFCAEALKAFDEQDRLDIFSSNLLFIDSDGRELKVSGKSTRHPMEICSEVSRVSTHSRWLTNPPAIMSTCFRTALLRKEGGFTKFAHYGHVWDEWAFREMAASGLKLAYHATPLVKYRIHPHQSSCHAGLSMWIEDIEAFCNYEDKGFQTNIGIANKVSDIAVSVLSHDPWLFARRVLPRIILRPHLFLAISKRGLLRLKTRAWFQARSAPADLSE